MIKEYEFLLDGLDVEESKILRYYLNEIQYKKDCNFSTEIEKDILFQCLAPCVCSIVRKILKKDNPYIRDYFDILIYSIDVKDIENKLNIYCDEFLPIAYKYLKYVDTQAEMLSIFCNDYLFGIINNIKTNKQKYIRLVKLKKIKYAKDGL